VKDTGVQHEFTEVQGNVETEEHRCSSLRTRTAQKGVNGVTLLVTPIFGALGSSNAWIRNELGFNLRYISTFNDFGKYKQRGKKIISYHPVHVQ